MPRIVLFELMMLALPFALFGLYRIGVRDAEVEGHKAWPLTALFASGIGLAIIAWLVLLLREDRDPNLCEGVSTLDPVTGKIIPGEEYECGLELDQIGVPADALPASRPETPTP